ncbi:hypothetical protein IV498_18345 [Paenarthrobacter sp. Z7-10]|uniref:hypothetical protein n=1 Tax=Paenarthrobacter sp. Z7-10 TaxID=2787635 RepID=UPI0022A904B4|nr:hypothetical protein [Paenarthrobacter sp. Z7-10]MCZ2405060.1 hypothetical protein [Paenarthrobacter sp. Z7-10]
MTTAIDDSDVQILAALSASLAPGYARAVDDPWIGSPFEWILKVPSRTKGALGEALVSGWAAAKGFDVIRSRNSDADRVINGHRIEIKLSSLWRSGGFKFRQIRDQEYDYCFCIGISPFDAQAWLLPKALLQEHVIGHMGQHTGASGTDTSWLGFQSDRPYEWMEPYGERLADVAQLLKSNGPGVY